MICNYFTSQTTWQQKLTGVGTLRDCNLEEGSDTSRKSAALALLHLSFVFPYPMAGNVSGNVFSLSKII